MKKEQIKTALAGIITQKNTQTNDTNTATTLQQPIKKTKRGFGKIVNFYLYDDDIKKLNEIVKEYNAQRHPKDFVSKSDIIRILINEKLK